MKRNNVEQSDKSLANHWPALVGVVRQPRFTTVNGNEPRIRTVWISILLIYSAGTMID